jgi:hypothetical protein
VSRNCRAVLRDCNGNHLDNLDPEEIEAHEWRAGRGELIKTVQHKRGRQIIVYTQKADPKPIEPSTSPNSRASLGKKDAEALAGCFGPPTEAQIERWMGWGLSGSAVYHQAAAIKHMVSGDNR